MIISIDLSKIEFSNDVFVTNISNDESLRFNRIDEDCNTQSGRLKMNIIRITYSKNGKRKGISNVIGVKNGKFRIVSTEKSIWGRHLVPDLMKMCYLEISDE